MFSSSCGGDGMDLAVALSGAGTGSNEQILCIYAMQVPCRSIDLIKLNNAMNNDRY